MGFLSLKFFFHLENFPLGCFPFSSSTIQSKEDFHVSNR
jgi:hypothetical protein